MSLDGELPDIDEQVEAYEEGPLNPEYLDELDTIERLRTGADTDTPGYFKKGLEELGADVEITENLAGMKVTMSAALRRWHLEATGEDLIIYMGVKEDKRNGMTYSFGEEDEIPSELKDVDKAMAAYTWQFYKEPLRLRAKRELGEVKEFVRNVTSALS